MAKEPIYRDPIEFNDRTDSPSVEEAARVAAQRIRRDRGEVNVPQEGQPQTTSESALQGIIHLLDEGVNPEGPRIMHALGDMGRITLSDISTDNLRNFLEKYNSAYKASAGQKVVINMQDVRAAGKFLQELEAELKQRDSKTKLL